MHASDGSCRPPAAESIPSARGPVAVVGSGPGWLVVEKPCGISIHNDPGSDLCSVVQNGLRQGRIAGQEKIVKTVHAVHRLDRDTSGLVLLAVDPELLSFFGSQFASQEVEKRYLALIHGHPTNRGADRSWKDWTWSLTAAAGGRKNPMGRGQRMPCATRWRIREYSDHFTLIECRPMTGRKHQIRRHAKLAGHPVVGDRRYGSHRSLDYLSRHFHFDRLGLHAHALTLRLPGKAQAVTFRSGGLPQAMRRLLELDRQPQKQKE